MVTRQLQVERRTGTFARQRPTFYRCTTQLWPVTNCDLVVPSTSLTIGDRTFSVAAARAWNRLPTALKFLRSTGEQTEEFSVS